MSELLFFRHSTRIILLFHSKKQLHKDKQEVLIRQNDAASIACSFLRTLTIDQLCLCVFLSLLVHCVKIFYICSNLSSINHSLKEIKPKRLSTVLVDSYKNC